MPPRHQQQLAPAYAVTKGAHGIRNGIIEGRSIQVHSSCELVGCRSASGAGPRDASRFVKAATGR